MVNKKLHFEGEKTILNNICYYASKYETDFTSGIFYANIAKAKNKKQPNLLTGHDDLSPELCQKKGDLTRTLQSITSTENKSDFQIYF